MGEGAAAMKRQIINAVLTGLAGLAQFTPVPGR
jgi:hypothetical protein